VLQVVKSLGVVPGAALRLLAEVHVMVGEGVVVVAVAVVVLVEPFAVV
jgi:hypothetical protein